MISRVSVENNTINDLGISVTGASYFICEEEGDVLHLPTDNIGIGSRALVIPTGQIYMLGGSRKWILYKGVSILE